MQPLTDTDLVRPRERQHVEPVWYTIDKDISQKAYDALLKALPDWYREYRTRCPDPIATARRDIDGCLAGTTAAGTPWFGAATASLSARIRIRCRFDLDTMQPLRIGSGKTRKKKTAERMRALGKSTVTPLPGYVYAVRCTGSKRIKIGRSVDPWKRLKDLGELTPYPLELIVTIQTSDMVGLESALHLTLKDYRQHGEWFTPSGQVLKELSLAIARVVTGQYAA